MVETQTSSCDVDTVRSRPIGAFWRYVGMYGWLRGDPDFNRLPANRFMQDHLVKAARRERSPDDWRSRH